VCQLSIDGTLRHRITQLLLQNYNIGGPRKVRALWLTYVFEGRDEVGGRQHVGPIVIQPSKSVFEIDLLFSKFAMHAACMSAVCKSKVTDKDECFIAVLMSHGTKGDEVIGFDGRECSINNLVQTVDTCNNLKGKPKLFIVQVKSCTPY
jgi:hypothetical protein